MKREWTDLEFADWTLLASEAAADLIVVYLHDRHAYRTKGNFHHMSEIMLPGRTSERAFTHDFVTAATDDVIHSFRLR